MPKAALEPRPHYTEFLGSDEIISRLYKHYFGSRCIVVDGNFLVKQMREGRPERVQGLLSSDPGRRQLLKGARSAGGDGGCGRPAVPEGGKELHP